LIQAEKLLLVSMNMNTSDLLYKDNSSFDSEHHPKEGIFLEIKAYLCFNVGLIRLSDLKIFIFG